MQGLQRGFRIRKLNFTNDTDTLRSFMTSMRRAFLLKWAVNAFPWNLASVRSLWSDQWHGTWTCWGSRLSGPSEAGIRYPIRSNSAGTHCYQETGTVSHTVTVPGEFTQLLKYGRHIIPSPLIIAVPFSKNALIAGNQYNKCREWEPWQGKT